MNTKQHIQYCHVAIIQISISKRISFLCDVWLSHLVGDKNVLFKYKMCKFTKETTTIRTVRNKE